MKTELRFFVAVVYHHCCLLIKFLWKTKENKTKNGTTTRDQLRELTESFS